MYSPFFMSDTFKPLLAYFLCIAFSLLLAGNLFAKEIFLVDNIVQLAKSLKLNESQEWKNLLHYYPVNRLTGSINSFVDDDKYFLSDNGKTDSGAEMEASIRVLFSDNQKNKYSLTDDNPHCRFVEREKWLLARLGLGATEVPEYCVKYHDWRKGIDAHSVTLVFPASYLNSPSSMFGHTLFRFDPENIRDDSTLLSYSLSYAADVTQDDEESFGYAFKGIAGGYPGRFSVVPYFQKIQEYGAIENRDVWEYKLDLNPSEVERMLNHAWELHDIHFDYYFFRENCAFRLLELLDYARPSLRLADQFNYTAIPASTVKAVVDSGIVEYVEFRPSIGTQLQYNLSLIASELRPWIKKLGNDPDLANSENFLRLDKNLQHTLLLTANQYLTYKSRRKEMDAETVKNRFTMLSVISRFPARKPVNPPTPIRPDKGHGTSMVSLGVGRQQSQDYSQFKYRISYHDLLDNLDGYLKGGEIELGDITIRKSSGHGFRLESFDIIQLRSLSTWYSLFDAISWEAGVSFERERLLENERMSFKLMGSAGKSLPLGKNHAVFGLLGPSLNLYDKHAAHSSYINAHLKFGVFQFNGYGTAQLQIVIETLQRRSARYKLELRQNIVLSKDHAIRLVANLHVVAGQSIKNVGISYRYTF